MSPDCIHEIQSTVERAAKEGAVDIYAIAESLVAKFPGKTSDELAKLVAAEVVKHQCSAVWVKR